MKTIFITGGSTGIGAACVLKFLAEGWNVAFMDLNEAEAYNMAGSCENRKNLLFISGDTRSKEDIRRAVSATVDKFGSLDSVFANAGIHRSNTLLDISDEELDMMIRTNIYGTVNTLRETVPEIIKAGGGTIVINCSDQWFVGKPHSFAYGLTKGALGQITRSLSIDLAKDNIRVNAICPGTIHTPLADGAFRQAEKAGKGSMEELWAEENALFARGKAGEPEEVAELVWFLASDRSSFCTGAHYLIDGGLSAG